MVIKCSKNGETEMCKHEIRRPECKNSSTGVYVTGRIRVAGGWFSPPHSSQKGQRGSLESRAHHSGLSQRREMRSGRGRWLCVTHRITLWRRRTRPAAGQEMRQGTPADLQPPFSLSQKQFKQLMERGRSALHLIWGLWLTPLVCD